MDAAPHDAAQPPATPAPRSMHRRHLLLALGLVGTAGLAAGGTAALWPTRTGHAGGARPDSRQADQPGITTNGPQQRHLSFGWLPAGCTTGRFGIEDGYESLNAINPGHPELPIQAAIFASGRGAPSPGSDPSEPPWITGHGATLINGHPTLWTTGTNYANITWQYTADNWASLAYSNEDPDPLTTARRIAANLNLTPTTRVPLPATPTHLPAPVRLTVIDATDNGTDTNWHYSLVYSAQPRPTVSYAPYSYLQLDVGPMNASQRAEAADSTLGADTTIDGHPARRTPNPTPDASSDQLDVWNVNGCRVTILVQGDDLLDPVGLGGVLGVWHHLHVTGQRSQWS